MVTVLRERRLYKSPTDDIACGECAATIPVVVWRKLTAAEVAEDACDYGCAFCGAQDDRRWPAVGDFIDTPAQLCQDDMASERAARAAR